MRKFRNSAIAIVSAAAITLGGMNVAAAQENGDNEGYVGSSEAISSYLGNGSSAWQTGEDLDADQPANGEDMFGEEKDLEGLPGWATAWSEFFDFISVASVLGMVIIPAVNWAKYHGILPN